MMIKKIPNIFFLAIVAVFFFASFTFGQTVDQKKTNEGKILIAVFLKHNQEKTLDEIQKHLDETGFWNKFPPEGAEVVSWYVI